MWLKQTVQKYIWLEWKPVKLEVINVTKTNCAKIHVGAVKTHQIRSQYHHSAIIQNNNCNFNSSQPTLMMKWTVRLPWLTDWITLQWLADWITLQWLTDWITLQWLTDWITLPWLADWITLQWLTGWITLPNHNRWADLLHKKAKRSYTSTKEKRELK